MKPPDINVKTFFLVALLLLVGMMLLDIAVMVFTQQHLIRSEKEKGAMLVGMIALQIHEDNQITNGHQGVAGSSRLSSVLGDANVSAAVRIDSTGEANWILGETDETGRSLVKEAREAMHRGAMQYAFEGNTWGVLWHQKKTLLVSGPVFDLSGGRGAVALSLRLSPVFARLRDTHALILLYLMINTVLLSLVGSYRIHCLAVRPITRIIRRAEAFRPGDTAFSLEENDENEMPMLSRAFNRILDLNREDQEKLRRTVSRLENAMGELKHAQQEIIRTEKLATVGRMASGIAHEIGNPIAIVLGYLDLLRHQDIDAAEKEDYIHRAGDEIGRIRAIIRQLLDYSRPSAEKRKQVPMHLLLTDLVQMAKVQPMFADMVVAADFAASNDTVSGDADQLKQLFLNLMLNAADAVHLGGGKEPGCLSIRSENSLPEEGRTPSMLRICFEDNGPGISKGDFGKIFDPFYTTKPPGMGTGLGLWVCLLIVEAMGGSIRAESEIGKGTRMIVTLPTAIELGK